MKTLFLHIGMPKTGTTSVQVFLSKNREILKEQGFLYPDFDIRFSKISASRNGHFLISMIRDESGERMYDRENTIEEACFEKLFSFFEEYPCLILSEEQLWSSAEARRDKAFWSSLKSRLADRGIELKLIVYLRRQDLFVQSSWAQEIKEKSLTLSLQEYISSRPFKRKKLNYYRRLNAIAKDVGKENIIVRVYEKEQWKGKNGTIISDFLSAIGAAYDERFEELKELQNRSLSGIYLETKRELNKIAGFNESKSYIQGLLKQAAARNGDIQPITANEFFSYEETIAFYEKYASSNRKVAIEYLGRQDGRLFLEEFVNHGKSYTQTDLSECIPVLAQMLSIQHEKVEQLREINCALKMQISEMEHFLPFRVKRKIKKILGVQ